MIIKLIIITAAFGVLYFGIGGRRTHVGRAWKKISLSLLALGMVVAVVFADATNEIAHFVGVGRGADLLLYILTLAFIAYSLNSYLQQQDEKDELYRLARKVAIIDANEHYSIKK